MHHSILYTVHTLYASCTGSVHGSVNVRLGPSSFYKLID